MVFVLVIVVLVILAAGLAWGARKSREADEVIKDMNSGRGVGPGVFGIFRRDRS